MRFPAPLTPATLLRRYKRFLADVRFDDGSETTVHCANPGAMTGLAAPGSRVHLSRAANPARKLAWSWELVEADGTLVGINTAHPNAIVAEAIAAGLVPGLDPAAPMRREVAYGTRSRVDLLLEPAGAPCIYVEVKNVHLMRRAGLAEFPDSVTARGARHLDELAAMVAAGHRAMMVYLVQRADCPRLALAADIDPAYAAAFRAARAAGVEAVALACRVSLGEIRATHAIAIEQA